MTNGGKQTSFEGANEREREREKLTYAWNINLFFNHSIWNERKSEQAHIPHAPTLLENAVNNEWQFQSLVTGNRTENQHKIILAKVQKWYKVLLKLIKSAFPVKMHIYTLCSSSLQSDTKFCWPVSVELRCRTVSSIFHFGQISKFKKGVIPRRKIE